MLITTSKENLNFAINAAQKAINPKSIIPLYSCIKLEVKDNLAIFTGAGLDISVECSIPVQTEKEGCVLIPSKHFGDIVRRLPDIPIVLEHTESMEMNIRFEKSLFTLKTMSVDGFPPFEAFKGGLDFTVPSELFKKLVRQSSFAASTDELKAVFTGILWEVNGEELSLVGTDTHRLAWARGAINSPDKDAKGSFIIPARIANEVSRLMQDEACHIQADSNTVFFTFDNIRINARILEGTFPDYRRVIPNQFVTGVHVNNKQLRDATERISLFSVANDASSTIHMDISDSVLSIHSRSDIGFGREEFNVQQEGDDINIAFNSRYITDVFKVIDAEDIDINLSGQLSAGIVREKDDENFLYLVLPVKV